MHDPLISRSPPDQAHGLRRLFAQAGVRLVPVVANPHMAFGGVLLERLCTALADQGARTLVVDASERAPAPHELAVMGLAECIEALSADVSYLAARTLPLRYLDTHGSTAPFLQAVIDAAPQCEVVLVHAGASELSRLFARQTLATQVRPMLLADDHPASVTHAYAAMKLLALRAKTMVFHLLLGAAPASPRASRIAEQLASCADTFLGALLHDWALVDPASHAAEAPPPGLRRLARSMLLPMPAANAARAPIDSAFNTAFAAPAASQTSGFAQALN
jgi:NAD(P)-dependent dehydrogenase (short-subunit alcohol dehydrogenase family)